MNPFWILPQIANLQGEKEPKIAAFANKFLSIK